MEIENAKKKNRAFPQSLGSLSLKAKPVSWKAEIFDYGGLVIRQTGESVPHWLRREPTTL